ncbi:hypothetical protein M3Y96_00089100 [Aphelenchoides besseyi]|nr:hypothetical protein M3Y96_00089100 [Aphelenchoides besseyi]
MPNGKKWKPGQIVDPRQPKINDCFKKRLPTADPELISATANENDPVNHENIPPVIEQSNSRLVVKQKPKGRIAPFTNSSIDLSNQQFGNSSWNLDEILKVNFATSSVQF